MITNFLKKHLDLSKPLLLALSGGADSKALLLLLLEYKSNFPFPLHIAHIDHGWRKESHEEASQLQDLALKLNVPFHLKVLKELPSCNLEEFCRDKRYEFFEELQDKYSFQAVVLAHHQDDLTETILKRIFEGSSFRKILGMDFITKRGSLTLWRPLLDVTKNNLLDFLKTCSETFFDDYTNKDKKYLRARLREELLPLLSKSFGKQISKPLLNLAYDLKEIDEYLDKKLASIFLNVIEGPFGLALDFNFVSEIVEIKYLVQKMALNKGLSIKKPVQNFLIDALRQNKSNWKLECKDHTWIVDRGFVFLISHLPNFENWKLEKTEKSYGHHWKDVWKGKVTIPKNDFTLMKAKVNERIFDRITLDKWWQQHKVPAFLREFVPVVYQNGKPVFEFLSGINPQKQVGVELESVNLIYITRY
jgi:tRNA(Ile)-lysidine synthase